MTGGRPVQTRLGRLRRRGVRVSSGPWTACAGAAPAGEGRLIVALGRAAGNATSRSRIRRIAREVFAQRIGSDGSVDLLLLVRSRVDSLPRRQVRARLGELMARLAGVLASRRAVQQEGNV